VYAGAAGKAPKLSEFMPHWGQESESE
jgi:hypothetical protein